MEERKMKARGSRRGMGGGGKGADRPAGGERSPKVWDPISLPSEPVDRRSSQG